jgi:hypothetical protein
LLSEFICGFSNFTPAEKIKEGTKKRKKINIG